jgi:hypothetical protein
MTRNGSPHLTSLLKLDIETALRIAMSTLITEPV